MKIGVYTFQEGKEPKDLKKENKKLKKDCNTLAQKLIQVKPELREWLEINFKEYL